MRTQKWFAAIFIVGGSFVQLGCATVQTRYEAEAKVANLSFEKAFQGSTRAALDAGFTIVSTDKDAGLIYGTRGANALLAHSNPAINISVQQRDDGVAIVIASTIGGQIIDYGITEETVTDFCASLAKAIEGARCTPK